MVRRRRPGASRSFSCSAAASARARVNDAALGLYDRWRDRPDVSVVHVTGRRDYAVVRRRLDARRRPDDRLDYELVEYEEHLERRYAVATVALRRAGAVDRRRAHRRRRCPPLLVPLPGAPHDHQTRNAEALADAGAAVGSSPTPRPPPTALGGELDRSSPTRPGSTP